MSDRKSLMSMHPRRMDVPVLLLAAAGLLAAGLSQPTLKLTKIIFFTDTYSIWGGIVELWKAEHRILAVIIFFFSIVFPIGKLVALSVLWTAPLGERWRRRLLTGLAVLGKWSMLDVFVVASLIVLIKSKDLADANAGPGIYLFGGAVALSMIVAEMIEYLAKKSL
ncbi:MAG: paraquat-inducible protein A [Phycisphaeraceae bacterium]